MNPASSGRQRSGRRSGRRGLVLAAAALVALGAAVPRSPAGAATALGCSWTVTSYDASGATIGNAAAPGVGATKDDPLVLARDGTIEWRGTSDDVLQRGSWRVEGGGLALSRRLGNDSGLRESTGREKVSDYLPEVPAAGALVSGLLRVDVKVTGESGSACVTGGWLRLRTGLFGSVSSIVGLGLLALSPFTLFWARAGLRGKS